MRLGAEIPALAVLEPLVLSCLEQEEHADLGDEPHWVPLESDAPVDLERLRSEGRVSMER